MKNTNFHTSLKQKLTLAALTGIIALPTLVTVPALQADPPKNAPAWGHRDADNKPGNDNHGRPGNNNQNKPGHDNDANNNNRNGWDNNGFDRNGFDRNGRDHDGRDHDGRDRSGFDRNGYDRNGYDKGGFNSSGYDRNGRDRNGHDRNWRPSPVLSNPGNWGNGRPGNFGGNYGSSLTIAGTVIDSLNMQDTLRVRADNGRVYTIPTSSARYYRVGNRVRVSGRLNGMTLMNASVSRY